jgi:hypothetical protein
MRWREQYLHGDAFIFVRRFNIVDPDVGTPDIKSIKATFVTTPDNHVVDLGVGAGINC